MRTVCAPFLYTFMVASALGAQQDTVRWAESQTLLRQLRGDFSSIAVADMDRDGRQDLLLGGAATGLHLNQGSMLFARAVRLPASGQPVAGLRVADFDGDGSPDLLRWTRAAQAPARIQILLQVSPGQFREQASAVLSAQRGEPRDVVVADVDRDGDPDLILALPGGLRLLTNEGRAGFVDRSATHLPGAGRALVEDLELGDLDRDGDLDLLLANRRPVLGEDWYYENDGQGRFRDATTTRLKGSPATCRQVQLADFDQNGELDLLVRGDWGLELFLENGHGLLVPTGIQAYVVVQASDVLVHDFDHDGDPDIHLVRPVSSWGHQLLRNDGKARFSDVTPQTPGLPAIGTQHAHAADLDGDGAAELLCLDQRGRLEIYTYSRLRGFEHCTRRDYGLAAGEIAWTLLHDVDGDAAPDLVSAAGVFLNDGVGGLSGRPILEKELARAAGAVAFDADGDGDADLFIAKEGFVLAKHPAGAQNRLLLNDGHGGYVDVTAARLPARYDTTVHAQAVDLDGDGDLDLVLANSALPNAQAKVGITILHNDGRGVFQDRTALLPPQSYDTREVLVADIDGRHGPDLVAVDVDQLRFYQRNASGDYAPVVKSLGAMPGRLGDAALFDADRDGDPDLFLAGTDGVRHLRNDGLGTFRPAPQALFPQISTPVEDLDVADVDGNGHPDLLLSAASLRTRLVCDYGGVFLERSEWLSCAAGGRHVAVADVDGDGDRDLAISRGIEGVQMLRGLAQQLHVALHPRPGDHCVLDLHYRVVTPGPRDLALLAFGVRRVDLQIPGIGQLGIVPELLLPGRPLVGISGVLEYRFAIPADFTLGPGIYAQGLLADRHGLRLTNRVALSLR